MVLVIEFEVSIERSKGRIHDGGVDDHDLDGDDFDEAAAPSGKVSGGSFRKRDFFPGLRGAKDQTPKNDVRK